MKKSLKPTQLAILVSALFAAPALWAQSQPTDVGRISVEGQGAGGLIQAEDTPKARSSVNKAYMDSLNPANNPYQAIALLPGVSTFSYDATGLFGGGMRVRGANSDQMGFTINGAPVNDSGSFSVFPQEYSDTENLCEIFVTQGSTDTEAPHVGASGGNIGMTTCSPKDVFGFKISQSFGDLRFYKTFIRVDSGKFANDMAKLFISYTKSEADKFKGSGKADKEHVDFGAEFRPNANWFAATSFLYNKAINNNYQTGSYANFAQFGTSYEFTDTPPQHKTPGAGAQIDTVSPIAPYYGYALNPFRNWLWTGKLEYKANKDLSFAAEPYFWFGYGTGGVQQVILGESGAAANRAPLIGGGIKDINGDSDSLDQVIIYRGSVTRTYRPGITLKSNFRLDNNDILVGYWYEQARHIQTQPGTRVDNNGNIDDLWLADESKLIRRADGSLYQGRDQQTISTASSVFLSDSIKLMQDRLNLQLGVRRTEIKRDFTNFANEGTGQGATYFYSQTYAKTMGSFGAKYALDAQQQVYVNIADNMKAPGNFSYQSLLNGGTVVNGALTGAFTQRTPNVQMETSTNLDLGYRYNGDALTFSGSVYYNRFKNRIARSFDPIANLSTDFNVGDVTIKGFELEAGYRFTPNWSVYGSLSNTSAIMHDNLYTSATVFELTGGKQLPDTPNWLSSLSINYASDSLYGSLQGKYNGHVYSTLVNDQDVAGYTQWDLTLGYKFKPTSFLKTPTIQLNVSNLFGVEYFRVNSPSGSNFVTRAVGAGSSQPFYYVGSPRFTSITLKSDF